LTPKQAKAFIDYLINPNSFKEYKTLFQETDILICGGNKLLAFNAIVAMQNTKGGIVVMGLRSNKSFRILNVDDVINKFNFYFDYKTKYQDRPKYTIISYRTERANHDVIIFEVERLPYEKIPNKLICRTDFLARVFKNGKTVPMSPAYYHVLDAIRNESFNDSNHHDFYNTKYDDKKLIEYFLKNYRKEHPSLIDRSDADILYVLNECTNTKTYAYILSFSLIPQAFLSTTSVYIIDRRLDIPETISIDGSIYNIMHMAELKLKKLVGYKLSFDINGDIVEKSKYLFWIISELLYNALIHRDYSFLYINDRLTIEIYTDRIVIKNPGIALYEGKRIIDSDFKLVRNRKLKMINDLLLDRNFKFHGFKMLKKISQVYNRKYPILENTNDGFFSATVFSEDDTTIYKKRLSIENILRFCKEPKTKLEIYQHFFETDKTDYGYFQAKYIKPLLIKGALKYTVSGKTRSKLQKIIISDFYYDLLYNKKP